MQIFEEDTKTLEAIASTFDEGSRQYEAVRHASIALWYVLTEGHDRFAQYVATFEGPLSEEQKSPLRQMGIDPDRDPG